MLEPKFDYGQRSATKLELTRYLNSGDFEEDMDEVEFDNEVRNLAKKLHKESGGSFKEALTESYRVFNRDF